MPILSFTIRDKVMDHVKGNPYYVCGNSDYVVKLDMDNEWGFALFTAVIKWYDRDGIGHKITKEFVGDSFEFPLIYDATRAEIGIYAGDKHTTTPGIVACRSSILTGELPEEPPTEDVYTQIIALIEAGAVKGKSPYIGEDNHWFEWDTDTNQYVDTGIRADYVLTDEDKEEIKEGAIQDIYDDIRSPLAAAEAARDEAVSAKDSATASATSAMASSASAMASANIANQKADVATAASETATNAKNVAVAAKESASASAATAAALEANVTTLEASVRTMQQFVAGVGVEVLDASQAVRADKNAAQAAAQAAESAATRAETAAEGLDEHIAQIQQNTEDIARHETAIDDLETLTAGHTETLATHTTEIDSLKTRMTAAETDIADHEEAIADNTENIEAHEKRLDNDERQIQILFDLTQGQVWDVQEDNTEAYQKTVLSGSRLGEVNKIGGRSIVDNQLYPLGTANIPTVSGNKFLKKLKGVESVVTADGTPIAMGENGTSPSAKFATPSGYANSRVDMLGGRSFKWNQIVDHDQSIPNSITGPNSMPITNVGNVYTGTRADSNNSIGFGRIISDRIIGNHVYYFSCDLKATSSATSIYARFSYSALIEPHQIAYTPGIWTRLQTVRKAVASPIDTYLSIYVDVGGDAQIGDTFEFDKDSYIAIDLTEVFGAGNEPMTAAAAVTALEKLGIDITQPQPYDPGSIKHTAVDSVKWGGNLFKWNQTLKFPTADEALSKLSVVYTIDNNVITFSKNGEVNYGSIASGIRATVQSNRKYLVWIEHRSDGYADVENTGVPLVVVSGNWSIKYSDIDRSTTEWQRTARVFGGFVTSENRSWGLRNYASTEIQVRDFGMIDLTDIFGAGNEPATVEDAIAAFTALGIDITQPQPYDPGSIRETPVVGGSVTQQVPAAVKALPGYGWGVGTASNHIERVGNKWQYVQEVSKLTLAIDDMNNSETYAGWKNAGIRDLIGSGINGSFGNLSLLPGNALANTNGTNDVIFVSTNPPMTQTEWKTQHAGEIYDIYVQRVTPIVTDVTEMMHGAMEPIQLTEGMVTTYVHSDSGAEVPHAISFYSNTDYLINLTRIFGAGKEPTTPADFHAILPGYDTSYNAGSIRRTAVDKVVWRGRNLLNLQDFINGSSLYYSVANDRIQVARSDTRAWSNISPNGPYVEANKTYTFVKEYDSRTYNIQLRVRTDNGEIQVVNIGSYPSAETSAPVFSITSPVSGQLVIKVATTGGSYPVDFGGLGIYEGEANTFTPYVPPVTQPIPSTVLALPGYGWGVGTAYNHIERTETGWQYVQEVDGLALSSANIIAQTYGGGISRRFVIGGVTAKPLTSNIMSAKLIWNNRPVAIAQPAIDSVFSYNNGEIYGYVKELDDLSTTSEQYKAWFGSDVLYYELPEPIITDITSLMEEALDSVDTETGGSVTFENTNGSDFRMPVPNTTEYIVKLSEARS